MIIETLEHDVFPRMNAFPLERSVIVLDNASPHDKHRIYALAQLRGIIVLFLPPYSYDFNPIELAFHSCKEYLRKKYGLLRDGLNCPLATLVREGLRVAITPKIACSFFEHCHIPVTDAEKEWAGAL